MKNIFVRMLLCVLCLMMVFGTVMAGAESYTVKLGASVGIYKGPGEDTGFNRTVGEDGVYTIVENAYDDEGNLWGKLKSGAGWVMLEENANYAANSVSYTVSLKANKDIYAGPGFDYDYLKDVGEDGVFTIVEEVYDKDGNLWGKLKSGAGWVNLKEAEEYVVRPVPYTVSLKADEDIYAGPGSDYDYLKDIGEDGVFTIIQEVISYDGFLWGKLKSGAGWVRLTDAPMEVPEIYEDNSYTVPLAAWVPIYSAPGYEEGTCVAIVGEDGVYTIVREVLDSYGNVWGELKSGAGWVDLDYVRTMGNPLMTAYFAEVIDLEEGNYVSYSPAPSEYSVQLAYRANADLTEVSFFTLTYDEDGNFLTDEKLHWLPEMAKGTYFVPEVTFYGDMTTYGISFLDEYGERRFYALYLSGMDGSIVFYEFITD